MILTGYAQQTGPAPSGGQSGYDAQMDYSFFNFLPTVPRIDRPQTLPVTWPPPGFFQNTPQQQGNFQQAFNPIGPMPLKNDAQLDQERREIELMAEPAIPRASSLLWVAAIGAVAYYVYKRGKS